MGPKHEHKRQIQASRQQSQTKCLAVPFKYLTECWGDSSGYTSFFCELINQYHWCPLHGAVCEEMINADLLALGVFPLQHIVLEIIRD